MFLGEVVLAFMEKIYLLKIYVTDRGKLAKTIFALKITAENGILRQERGGLVMSLTSQDPSPPFHVSPLPKRRCREWTRGEALAEPPC